MKTKLIPLILALAAALAFITGCTSGGENPDSLREKVTNVFKKTAVDVPDEYELYTIATGAAGGRIYMKAGEYTGTGMSEYNPRGDRRDVIASMDMNGENLRFDPLPINVDENATLIDYCVQSNGDMLFLVKQYDPQSSVNEYFLYKKDADGKEIFTVNVTKMYPFQTTMGFYFSIRTDSENRICIWEDMGSSGVLLSADGEKLFLFGVERGMRIHTVAGKFAVEYNEYPLGHQFRYIDTDGMKIGEELALPESAIIGNNYVFSTLDDDDSGFLLYYEAATGIYGVSETETAEVLNWLNSSLSGSNNIVIADKDNIFYRSNDSSSDTEKEEVSLLTRIPDDKVAAKYTIELGYASSGSNDNILRLAAKFNSENDDYRITLTDYTQLAGSEHPEYAQVESFVNLELAAGRVPDLFILNSTTFTGKNYENKNLFADIYEYLDADTELTRDNFIPSALTAFETDGKLYRLASKILPRTIVGKTENVAHLTSWTLSDMVDAAESLKGSGSRLFAEQTPQSQYEMLTSSMVEFIDYESGTCSFNSGAFISLLGYLQSLSKGQSAAVFDFNDPYKLYLENTALMRERSIYTFIDYLKAEVEFGTEDLTYPGYPGVGTILSANTSYAISAQSDKVIRDGAWEFIKTVMLADVNYHDMMPHGFPSTYEAYHKLAEMEMEMYYVIYPGGYGGSSNEFTPENLSPGDVPARVTQDTADRVLAFLESANSADTLPAQILEIINEETAGFFAGTKSAEDTADFIQNRVSIYLSESN